MESLKSIDRYAMAGGAWQIAMIVVGALTIFVFPCVKETLSFSISIRSVGIAIVTGIIGTKVVAATIRVTGRQLEILVVVTGPVVEELPPTYNNEHTVATTVRGLW